MSKIIIAAEDQRMNHDGIYPLHGYLDVGGTVCEVEDLRGWDRDNPQWEVLAPEGYHFLIEGTHSVLGFTQAELINRVRGDEVVRCDSDCDCGWEL